MQYIWLTYVDYILIYVTRLPARSDLSLNAMSVKVLNHPQCNKPTNMLIWGIAPGYRDKVFPYPSTYVHRIHISCIAIPMGIDPRCRGSVILHTRHHDHRYAGWANYSEA